MFDDIYIQSLSSREVIAALVLSNSIMSTEWLKPSEVQVPKARKGSIEVDVDIVRKMKSMRPAKNGS